MIGILIRYFLRRMKISQFRRNREGWYKRVIQCNPELKNFSNFIGEERWLEKWRKWDPGVSSMAYRIFSQYIGDEINIIPYEVTDAIVEPVLTPVEYREVYNDKNSLGLFLPQYMFQKTFLRRINGFYYDSDILNEGRYRSISRTDAKLIVDEIYTKKTNVVTKGTRTGGGEGVTIFRNFGDKLINKFGEDFSLSWLEKKYGDNFLIEEVLVQSNEMYKFCHSSVNTIRMITLRVPNSNSIVCLNAVLRIGKEGAEVDNACQGGSFVGIYDDGTLGKFVCDGLGRTSKIFNGINFEDNIYVIPNYDEVKRFAISVHEKVLYHDLIAMDIAIKENNEPSLIEINVGAFSSNLFQFTISPTFNEYTDVVMNYCTQRMKDYYPKVVY